MNREGLIEEAAKAIHTDYTTRYAEEPPVYHAGVAQPVWRHMARAALAVFEQAHAPTDDEWEALLRAIVPSRRRRIAAASRAVDRILAAGFRRTDIASRQGEPSAPDGWFPFGSHAPYPWVGRMEFSDEKDDAGMPCWERPVQGEPTDAQVIAALNAYDPRFPGEDLDDFQDNEIADMRAALRAAAATQ